MPIFKLAVTAVSGSVADHVQEVHSTFLEIRRACSEAEVPTVFVMSCALQLGKRDGETLS